MAVSLPDAVASLRRPAYTGENRCVPCTAVNLVIAVGLAAGLGIVVPAGTIASAAVGAAGLGLSVAVIYLRGYLVPGTPWLTRTYFPDRVLAWFDKSPRATGQPGSSGADPEFLLGRAGAVEECADEDDLCLTDAFRTAWHRRIEELGGAEANATAADLAWLFDVPEAAVRIDRVGGAVLAMGDGSAADWQFDREERIAHWPSAGAYLADLGGARALADRLPEWSDLPYDDRSRLLAGLRVFIDRCPSCGGPVEFGEDVVRSCCRSRDVIAVTCQDCGDRLFEADRPDPAGD